MRTEANIESSWNKRANDWLLNRKIVHVSYMTDDERKLHYWYKRPVMFQLDNGLWCYPSQDDEGNDGGALFLTNEEGCLPVL